MVTNGEGVEKHEVFVRKDRSADHSAAIIKLQVRCLGLGASLKLQTVQDGSRRNGDVSVSCMSIKLPRPNQRVS